MKAITLLSVLGQVALLTLNANAHPGEEHEVLTPYELAKRYAARDLRHNKAKRCAPHIARFESARKAKRSLQLKKRQDVATATASAVTPHYTTIQNTTCVTAPEVTEGPYYVNNELIRQDIRDEQPGLPLILDLGIMDTTTCSPLSDALVELWHCNTTGYYAGFTGLTSTTPGGDDGAPGDIPGNGTAPGNGTGPPPGGPGGSQAMTDQETFLRGAWVTGGGGVVEMTSVYPGYYTGRTAHIHLMVHTNYTVNSNGTISSHAGTLLHIGQLFFDDAVNDQVFALSPYNTSQQSRTRNDEDGILSQQNSDGYSGFVSLEQIDPNSIEAGFYGYLTVGVDTSADQTIASTNYASGIPEDLLLSASSAWSEFQETAEASPTA
ncbi:aromatic compound dioxygenase [Atractiella rhizophila]|nr:aromatic compound dioxygenase [Atractiella rhizophila]